MLGEKQWLIISIIKVYVVRRRTNSLFSRTEIIPPSRTPTPLFPGGANRNVIVHNNNDKNNKFNPHPSPLLAPFPSPGRSLCSAANKETPCGPSHLNFRLFHTYTPLVPQKRRESFGLARKIHDNKKRLPRRPSSPEMGKIEEWGRKYWILIPYCFNTPGKSASYLRFVDFFRGMLFPFRRFQYPAPGQFSRFLIRFPVRYERVFIYTRAYFNPLMF